MYEIFLADFDHEIILCKATLKITPMQEVNVALDQHLSPFLRPYYGLWGYEIFG